MIKEPKVQAKAKVDAATYRLISGYTCWFPCIQTYFQDRRGKFPQNSDAPRRKTATTATDAHQSGNKHKEKPPKEGENK
jgi:hypothetical protein